MPTMRQSRNSFKRVLDDIYVRHSTVQPMGVEQQRAGQSFALLVHQDDIIDMRQLKLVKDRGVLRNAKAGGFAIGITARKGRGSDSDGESGEDGWEEASSGDEEDSEPDERDGRTNEDELRLRFERTRNDEHDELLAQFELDEARRRAAAPNDDDDGEDDLDDAPPLLRLAQADSDDDELAIALPSQSPWRTPTKRARATTAGPASTTKALRVAIETISLLNDDDSDDPLASPPPTPTASTPKQAAAGKPKRLVRPLELLRYSSTVS